MAGTVWAPVLAPVLARLLADTVLDDEDRCACHLAFLGLHVGRYH